MFKNPSLKGNGLSLKRKFYIFEEQEIFYKLYESLFSTEFECEFINDLSTLKNSEYEISKPEPGLILISLKRISEEWFETIYDIARKFRGGFILMLVSVRTRDIPQIKRLATAGSGGKAFFLKKSLDMTDQLNNIVHSVIKGQVIIDPSLSSMLLSSEAECPFLTQMTSREQEILALLANGYTNAAIAKYLYIDLKTVEHHINNMYSKLKAYIDFEEKHPRVQAARLYLEATGELPELN